MNHLAEDMENALTGNQSSHASLHNVHSINPTQLMARIESYEGREKKGISDVRRTFCLFVTFDLLFVTLLWITVKFFRFNVLILAYAVCRLRHWWAILFSQGAFGYVLPIISFILAWIEMWFLDFKVLPQEAAEENRLLIVQDASERAALTPGGLSDGQFYSPPESEIGSEEAEENRTARNHF
uniref:MENTAL domain-containing protein n=1 Tax=Rhinopithecus bieti TaxID=61621 RepID=A0A2K6M355_RHIBE